MSILRGLDGVPMQAPTPPRQKPAAAPPSKEEQRSATDPMPDTVPTVLTREDEYTRVHRPGADDGPMADPPAGWLVIVDGPGQGRAVTLGLHHNPIGRDETNRVALDYGDETISRRKHLLVTYDPEGRRFYVTPGDGTNLCYVNDQPVLASMPLEPGARIRTGRTTLRFVPLCGPDFSWDAAAAADAGGGADAGDA